MNLVGKILTVLIFVMSLVFMSFAVAVYATHKNWKEEVLSDQPSKPGYVHQLKKAKERNEELKTQKTKLEGEVDSAKKAKDEAIAKLENELEQRKTELTEKKQQEAKLITETREAVAAMAATQERLKELRDENQKLRDDIGTAQKDKDAAFTEVVKLTDQLNQAALELKALKERDRSLAQEHAKAMDVLRKFGLVAEPERYRDQPPAGVKGVVLAVTGDDLVEISIGTDDGILEGQRLDVVRMGSSGSNYVGRLEVIKTDANRGDRAVCKILPPPFKRSQPQKDDRVIAPPLKLLGEK